MNEIGRFLVVSGLSLVIWSSFSQAQGQKILDRTLFEATEQDFRYSEAAVLNVDGKKRLLMTVSVFGDGGHDDSVARILAWVSNDGGLTWKKDPRHVFQENIGKKNVMSPSFLRLSRQEVLFFFLITDSNSDAGMWLRRSLDNGKTWGKPVRLPYEGYGGVANDHALLLKRGRILLPYWESRDALASSYSFCFYSDDKSHSWKKSNEITVNLPSKGRRTHPAAEEPAVLELEDGRLLMLLRTYVGWFYKSYSADGGATWSEPVNSGIPAPGSMPTLVRIPGRGDILLLFNYGELEENNGPLPRNRMASAISRDEGENFTSIRILDGSPEFQGKMTMANVTFVDDNAVLFYSKSPTKENFYSWRQQIIPIRWFYEGDSAKVYGEKYLRNKKSMR
jgi:sialidase-1